MNPIQNDIQKIKKALAEDMERLESISKKWAGAKANKSKAEEMKKVILNIAKSASNKNANNAKEMEAYQSEEYRSHLERMFEAELDFYDLDSQKSVLEKRIDYHRSLLSFEKYFVELTK